LAFPIYGLQTVIVLGLWVLLVLLEAWGLLVHLVLLGPWVLLGLLVLLEAWVRRVPLGRRGLLVLPAPQGHRASEDQREDRHHI
jgi:hypothetical protein